MSGYAVYRAWFDPTEKGVDKDPLTSYLCTDEEVFYGWIGKHLVKVTGMSSFPAPGHEVDMLTSSSRNGKTILWVVTHK